MTVSCVSTAPSVRDVATAAIRDGSATFRPLGAEEHGALDAVFRGLSPASRYDRYLTGVDRLTGQMRSALMAIDGDTHIAWLGEVEGRPAAIGRLIRVAPRTAELALEVVDAHQGRGLGTALLDTLMTVASVSGIDTIRGSVLPSNERSQRLLRAVRMSFRFEDGLLEGVAPVRLRDPAVVDRCDVVRLALAVRRGQAQVAG